MMDYDLSAEKQGKVNVNGVEVETKTIEITSCNIIEVEVGTTGYCGGDTGHGGRTYLRIKNLSSTDMEPKAYFDDYGHSEVEIALGGDCELDTFIAALEFAVDTLKQQTGGTHTMTNKERKQENFKWYLNDVVMLYRKNGNLNGMSAIQKRYHVSSITKTQFFECGLDEAAKSNAFLGDDFCNKVYEYVLNRAKGIPAPKYKAE